MDANKTIQLILVRGIPGSGKSTLAKQIQQSLLATGASPVILEADMYFIGSDGEYRFNKDNIRHAHQWCQEKTRQGLESGSTIIVANTFTTLKEMRPYFDIGQQFGVTPIVYLAQNQFVNIHNVPEETLVAMRQRFVYDISPLFDKVK